MIYLFNSIMIQIQILNEIIFYINKKRQPLTICKLHCGIRGVSFAGVSQHRSVLSDRNELQNPQRQLASDRTNKS